VLGVPMPPAFATSFGHPDSAARHRADAERQGLACIDVESASLAYDVDTPDDHEGERG
jgi:2-phospho-L-lactate guanylyltransferase (CobY/MobA/RfbA family)